jgi:hypothetical protein
MKTLVDVERLFIVAEATSLDYFASAGSVRTGRKPKLGARR